MSMKIITAEIITIGDEILFGHITDTNAQWISQKLSEAGIRVVRKTSIGDSREEILNMLAEAEQRADIILLTGGLGPTSDDVTKQTLAEYFQSDLILFQDALQDVTGFFQKRGRPLTEINRQQAFLPDKCICIRNTKGTAPGMWFEKNGKVFVSMPGVPFEMKGMMENNILPQLIKKFKTSVIYHKIIHCVGIGESFLSDKISGWEKNLPSHLKLAYLPSFGEVKLRLTSVGGDAAVIKSEIAKQVALLQNYIQGYIFGYDEDNLPDVVGQLLKKNSCTIAAAESCTGGYFSHLITSVPGSSEYFKGSVVAYANEVKQEMLGVKEETLLLHGAVSEETVKEMAAGVRKKFGTEVGVSISGIAGPGGGSAEKPVGTVWMAYSDAQGTIAKKITLGGERDLNIKISAVYLLNMVRQSLLKKS